jgi:hypothetical protein
MKEKVKEKMSTEKEAKLSTNLPLTNWTKPMAKER